MKRKFYSATRHILQSFFLSPPTRNWNNKPDGGHFIWASGEIDSGELETHWTRWVKGNWESEYETYKYLIEVEFIWEKIFEIEYKDEYTAITKNGNRCIDYPKVAKHYGGVYLDPGMVFYKQPGYLGFRDWETETLVIWDAEIITSAKQYIIPK